MTGPGALAPLEVVDDQEAEAGAGGGTNAGGAAAAPVSAVIKFPRETRHDGGAEDCAVLAGSHRDGTEALLRWRRGGADAATGSMEGRVNVPAWLQGNNGDDTVGTATVLGDELGFLVQGASFRIPRGSMVLGGEMLPPSKFLLSARIRSQERPRARRRAGGELSLLSTGCELLAEVRLISAQGGAAGAFFDPDISSRL